MSKFTITWQMGKKISMFVSMLIPLLSVNNEISTWNVKTKKHVGLSKILCRKKYHFIWHTETQQQLALTTCSPC
jgi:hypothetical protein